MATIRRKKSEPFAIVQKDPGPWPQVLINWLATLAVIIVFGLIMLFSASYTTGYLRMGDSFYYIKSQVFCLGLGLAVMLLFSRIDHRFLRRMVGPGYVVCIVMLIAVLFSAPLNGCRRWLRIGFTIQVSEIAKFEMILLTAHLAAKAPHLEKLDPASGRRVPAGQWLYQRIVRELIVPLLPLIPVVILLAMLIGAAIGCFNGLFVAKFKLHPFIVTLGTQLILYTCLLLYVQQGNNNGMAISNLDPSYTSFVKGELFRIGSTPVPMYVLFAVVLTAVMWFIWNKTTFGKNMFALGSNEEAARVSGVNVFAITVGVFALAGAMYGFTGFIEGARIGSNTANTGLNYELDAIAACVIGGVSFVGGIGKISGIVIGVLMLRLIFIGLTMVGVPQDLQYLIKGAIILFACALDMRKYLVKK